MCPFIFIIFLSPKLSHKFLDKKQGNTTGLLCVYRPGFREIIHSTNRLHHQDPGHCASRSHQRKGSGPQECRLPNFSWKGIAFTCAFYDCQVGVHFCFLLVSRHFTDLTANKKIHMFFLVAVDMWVDHMWRQVYLFY